MQRPALGITFVATEQREALNIPYGVLVLDATSQPGLQGCSQRPNGGMVLGDTIIAICAGKTNDVTHVNSEDDLARALDVLQAGERATLTVLRQREGARKAQAGAYELKIQITLLAAEASLRGEFVGVC